MRATAGMGDAFTSSFMAVPFANGNATVSLQRPVGKVVVPNLHASAAGSTLGGPGRGISTSSAGSDAFSDLLSITEAQLDATNLQDGRNLAAIWVGSVIPSAVQWRQRTGSRAPISSSLSPLRRLARPIPRAERRA
jgi:hypothetical protein